MGVLSQRLKVRIINEKSYTVKGMLYQWCNVAQEV